MTHDKKPSPEDLSRRQRWFEDHIRELRANSVVRRAEPGVRYACPCCRCLTLDERGGYEICPVCFWEDDGQDDHDADRVRGGPNGSMSLDDARRNYAAFGACDEKSKQHVRSPLPDELPNAG